MGDALQPGDLLVTIEAWRSTTEEAEPEAQGVNVRSPILLFVWRSELRARATSR